ncbi:MAG: hypothetical protein ACTHOM_04810 [Allomuricauda sp.]
MKTLFTIIALFLSLTIYSQKYEIGAMTVMGFTTKMKGTIELTDNMMLLELETKKGITNADYDIINERNGITYVSDGTETFNTSIIENKGRKKGFKHTYVMNFVHPTGQHIIYYINLL